MRFLDGLPPLGQKAPQLAVTTAHTLEGALVLRHLLAQVLQESLGVPLDEGATAHGTGGRLSATDGLFGLAAGLDFGGLGL